MPESTLNRDIDTLKARIGEYLGFTSDSTAWDADQKAKITTVLDAGMSQFAHPPLVGGMSVPHEWTFLQPTFVLSTRDGVADYDLPEDCASIEDDIVISNAGGYVPEVKITSPERIISYRQDQARGGVPQWAGVRVKASAGRSGPRYELLLWPTPDSGYDLVFRYNLLPNALTSDAPYPLGGAQHSETLLYSCLAAADAIYNDQPGGGMWAMFERNLVTSILRDQRESAPRFYGRNVNSRRRFGERHMSGAAIQITPSL